MSKKVIVILSVLKPVDDTRNFEKIATSISNTNKYDINIIGFCTKIIPTKTNITFHPIFKFGRLSIKRLLAPVKTFQFLVKLKPQLVIATCAELLIVISIYKIIFGCKFIYDVQENYYRNILHTSIYGTLIRYPMAILVRGMEWMCNPMVDRYLLAEKVYEQQLCFCRNKSEVIENKAIVPFHLQPPIFKDTTTFLYTGTIAVHYGIFEAIDFIKHIHKNDKSAQMRIVGYAPDKRVYKRLLDKTQTCDYIKIEGGDVLVPHNQILMEIANADFCLLPYQKNKSTEGRIPTKLYECLAMEKPVIISPNDTWNEIIKDNNAGIIHDFYAQTIPDLKFISKEYYGNQLSKNYSWKSEESKLLQIINDIF